MTAQTSKNPYEQTGRSGKGGFWRLGQLDMADAIVTISCAGNLFLLMVERKDGLGFALPGGHVEENESSFGAAFRELREETGLDLLHYPLMRMLGPVEALPPRYVADPRTTDDAWAVTTPVRVDLGTVNELPAVEGGDDAKAAHWMPAGSYAWLAAEVGRMSSRVFPAHRKMLQEILGEPLGAAYEGRLNPPQEILGKMAARGLTELHDRTAGVPGTGKSVFRGEVFRAFPGAGETPSGQAGATIVSFGYGHGDPPRADVVIDVRRHFRDPSVLPEMRERNGFHPEATRLVMETPGVRDLVRAIADVVCAFGAAGPEQLPVTVAIGCAGGRHRGPVIAGAVGDILVWRGVPVDRQHRDITKPVLP